VNIGLNTSASDKVEFSDGEKLNLLMQCEIYNHLGIDGEIDPKFVGAVINGGHNWALKWEYTGIFHGHQDNENTVSEVVDILDMWLFIESGHKSLSKQDKSRVKMEAKPFGEHVAFPGFDGNNESEHLSIAIFLTRDLGRFSFLKNRGLNSHCPSIEAYQRMFAVFEPIRRNLTGGELNATQIIELLQAKMHPDHQEP
jgi:uncharacterized protein YfbU (UPF0304 family)